ncbi:MAG: DUF1156 domain-containing protein [Gammaproteobacteria bacterium]|nr:DUF1156 domain-containing protein [Gammaproteobacteria bacterium]
MGDARPSFIETQFPVSRLSKESYKERDAKNSQTLTAMGKWWGRKPLVMVRAAILGLLVPASADPQRDRQVFLALMTMDDDGLRRRKTRNIPLKDVHARLSLEERRMWFAPDADHARPKFRKGVKIEDKKRLQLTVFDRMSYDEKLKWCDRPEQIDGPSEQAWHDINAHLGTSAADLAGLVRELGERYFGRVPKVGDAFCGGGSVPFEAARLGCEAFGSDLNPVAALLTWGALNIIGGGPDVAACVRKAQQRVFDAVDRQVTDWRIEHNDVGWRADAFLYCTETSCPECGWRVPLAPSWIAGEKPPTIASLVSAPEEGGFDIDIQSGVDANTLAQARQSGTVKDSRLECPNCHQSTPISALRGDDRKGRRGFGLRRWSDDDLVPHHDDVFGERLYCVRWRLPRLDALLWAEQRGEQTPVPSWVDPECAISALTALLGSAQRCEIECLRKRDWLAEERANEAARLALQDAKRNGSNQEISAAEQRLARLRDKTTTRAKRLKELSAVLPKMLYRPVDKSDMRREREALRLIRRLFPDWRSNGFIPTRAIAPGAKTDELTQTRGWTHWHQLFTPRQLLVLGLLSSEIHSRCSNRLDVIASTLGLSRCIDYNSKLCRWHTRTVGDKSEQTFSNQALNTMLSFAARGTEALRSAFFLDTKNSQVVRQASAVARDARSIDVQCDIWLTDPPYADAVNYHELSEYLLAWHERSLSTSFADWYADSKRALAIRGAGQGFRHGMVECYTNLATRMPNNGYQVVMFTHQDASVWADLALILWAAGLRVTTAWTISTETKSSLKQGNYVQGTVLMVLRKQASQETAFADEVIPQVEIEVERQLDAMRQLDDRDDPNFSDADLQLAAYAAALRVLTKYRSIEDIDIARELAREGRGAGDSPIRAIIEDAVRTASNHLVPTGLPNHLWRQLGPEEKLYLKGLEVESHGDYRSGVYQEFARGFGVHDYRFLLHSDRANETRLKTASEFGRQHLGDSRFTGLVRHALYAVWRANETEDIADSLVWLRTELADYWPRRDALVVLLRYLAAIEIGHWRDDAQSARLIAGAVENDHV